MIVAHRANRHEDLVNKVWDRWVPGVLSKNQMRQLCDSGYVNSVDFSKMDHSSIDLHLTADAYHLTRGSVKPFGPSYLKQLRAHELEEKITPNADGNFLLKPRSTYLFRLKESLHGLKGLDIWGQATAKSSVGRVDVLARLVVDGMKHYERFSPEDLPEDDAELFLEVTPFTFPVVVRQDTSLNQLRLFYGRPEDCELTGKEIARTCLAGEGRDNHLTVNLNLVDVQGVKGCGFRASRAPEGEPIALWKKPHQERPDPSKWWKIVQPDRHGRLSITRDHFYILRSNEKLTLPAGVAVYARAIDEEIGEMRIHYAGFAHPFFGWERLDEERGTPLIFEVRGHDVNVSLRNEEILARLRFFRMSEDAARDSKETKNTGEESYNEQDLKLSGYFSGWSAAPTVAGDSE
jgi:dCTP deaminase